MADRDRDRITLLAHLLATGDMSVNALVAWTKDTFLNPEQPRENSFGLLSYKSQTHSIGADYIPGDAVGVGASYNFDRYDGLSQSRNARPGAQFADPDRNWTTDEGQKGHSFLAYVEFPQLFRDAELRVDYDYSKYTGLYLYETGPAYTPSPSEPGGIGQLPAVTAEEHRLSADLRYFLRRTWRSGSRTGMTTTPSRISRSARPANRSCRASRGRPSSRISRRIPRSTGSS